MIRYQWINGAWRQYNSSVGPASGYTESSVITVTSTVYDGGYFGIYGSGSGDDISGGEF